MAGYGTRKDMPLGPPVGGEIGVRAARGSSPPTRSNFTQRNMARLKRERDAVNLNRKTMEDITGDSTWYSKRPRP